MRLLILGDVMGLSGRNALKNKLPNIIEKNKIDFVIVNGENAADDGRGITQSIAEEFFSKGVDVITSGNHIWDKQETADYIDKENRLLRPANLVEGSPGRGYEIYSSKNQACCPLMKPWLFHPAPRQKKLIKYSTPITAK